jgi:hypothetical protein
VGDAVLIIKHDRDSKVRLQRAEKKLYDDIRVSRLRAGARRSSRRGHQQPQHAPFGMAGSAGCVVVMQKAMVGVPVELAHERPAVVVS